MSAPKNLSVFESLLLLHKVQSHVMDLSKTVFGMQILNYEFLNHMVERKIQDWPLFYLAMQCNFTHANPEHVVLYNTYHATFIKNNGLNGFDFTQLGLHISAWHEMFFA